MQEGIAIVGMSALFPGAASLEDYWQNILDCVDSTSDADDDWSIPYFALDSADNDRIYTRRGGFLKGLSRFDPAAFGVMPNSVDGAEPDQFVALKLAADALADAGYASRSFDRTRAGVIVGHATLLNRGNVTLLQHGMVVDQTLAILSQLLPEVDEATMQEVRAELKRNLPLFDAEVAPGMTPNVLSGRIANKLNLMGPNYIVDAACASSLLAVEQSCRELLSGRSDLMLSGGVNISTSPQVFMVFCRLGALSRGRVRPFDAAAAGTLLGEGAGMLVLKRLSDAERDGDRIYAVLRGIGVASDGRGAGLMAPRLEGEMLAVERAYVDAGISPQRVGLIEAHGTGIPLGDRTEAAVLARVFGARGDGLPERALGSVKSMISHTIPAAGAASLIKTALALYHRVLPPTLCDQVSPALGLEQTSLYVNTRTRPWIHGGALPRCAGVNAFGFGGINSHAVLEAYPQEAREQHYTRWATELYLFSGATREQLLEQVVTVEAVLAGANAPAPAALAAWLAAQPVGAFRLAVTARTADLPRKLAFARERITAGKTSLRTRDGATVHAEVSAPPKVAFLFPGEGAQYPGMLDELCRLFPAVRLAFDGFEASFAGGELRAAQVLYPPPTTLSTQTVEEIRRALFEMDIGSGVVSTACLALHRLLCEFGVRADVMVGHSTGEFAALVASGTVCFLDEAAFAITLLRLRGIPKALEAEDSIPRGALLAVGALPMDRLLPLIDGYAGRVHIAIDNCPNQSVLFVPIDLVDPLRGAILAEGGVPVLLPFDRAYHTPLFSEMQKALEPFYANLEIVQSHTPIFSAAAVTQFPLDAEGVRAMALAQWAQPVRFRETIERLYAEGVGLFLEVGPSGNLCSFVNDILRGREAWAVPMDTASRGGLEQLQMALGELWARGVEVDIAPLFARRQIVPWLQTATATSPTGRDRSLKIALPRMALSDIAVHRLRVGLRLVSGDGDDAGATGESETETSPAAHFEPTSLRSQSIDISNPRRDALSAHFGLMQQFLAQQQRLFAGLSTVTAQASVAAQRFPAPGRVLKQEVRQLVFEREVNLEGDRYLLDHVFGGVVSDYQPGLHALPVIPFMVSLEWLAEGALSLHGGGVVVSIEDVRGNRWLTLDRGVLSVQGRIERTDEGRYHGRLFVEEDGGSSLVFEASLLVARHYPASPPPLRTVLKDALASNWSEADLYSTGMFHGPLFQCVRHVNGHLPDGIELDAVVPAAAPCWHLPVQLLDAVGQAVAYWYVENHQTTDFNSFPYRIERITLHAPAVPSGTRVVLRGSFSEPQVSLLLGSCDILTIQGVVLVRVEGMHERVWHTIPIPSYYRCRIDPRLHFLSQLLEMEGGIQVREIMPFPPGFLENSRGIWLRALAHLMLGASEREYFYRLAGPRRVDWLMGRIAAKDAVRAWRMAHGQSLLAPADIEILPDRLGAPVVRNLADAQAMPTVSISHKHGRAVAIAMANAVGLDFELLVSSPKSEDFTDAFSQDELAVVCNLPAGSGWLTLWCAREAAAKYAGTGLEGVPKQWVVSGNPNDPHQLAVQNQGRIYNVRTVVRAGGVFAYCFTHEH